MGAALAVVRPVRVRTAREGARVRAAGDIAGVRDDARGARRASASDGGGGGGGANARPRARAYARGRGEPERAGRRRAGGGLEAVQDLLRRGAQRVLRAVRPRGGVRQVRAVDRQVPDVPQDVPKRSAPVFLVSAPRRGSMLVTCASAPRACWNHAPFDVRLFL